MEDQSYLDRKYFIDSHVYNCPFCNRRNVSYTVFTHDDFDWTDKKKSYVYYVLCSSCRRKSMHLSYEMILDQPGRFKVPNIDSKIFYSVPTSFFVLDDRIPSAIRELITEAEGCIKMNFLTGASACMRKAIYELTVMENSIGDDYQTKVKSLKNKYPDSDPRLFDILAHIQDMTSDKIHEQSWDEWDSNNLKLIIETLKAVLYDIYVQPKIKAARSNHIQQLLEKVSSDKKSKTQESSDEA